MANGFKRSASKFAIGVAKGFKGGREAEITAKFALAKADRSEKIRQQRLQEGLALGVERDRLQAFAKSKKTDSATQIVKEFFGSRLNEFKQGGKTGFLGKNREMFNVLNLISQGKTDKLPDIFKTKKGANVSAILNRLGGKDAMIMWALENDPNTAKFAFPAEVERLLRGQ